MSYSDKLTASGNPVNPYSGIITAINELEANALDAYSNIMVTELLEPVDITVQTEELEAVFQELRDTYMDRIETNWWDGDAYKNKIMFLSAATGIQNDINRIDGLPPVVDTLTLLYRGTATFDDVFLDEEIDKYITFKGVFDALLGGISYDLAEFTTEHSNIMFGLNALLDEFTSIISDETSAYGSAMAMVSSYSYVAFSQTATGTLANVINTLTPGVI